MNNIKYILGLWISIENNPPNKGEYLVLGEYGIATMYYTEGHGYAGDADIGEILYWKRIKGLPDCKYKKYINNL